MTEIQTFGIKEILEHGFTFSRVLYHGNDYLIAELSGMNPPAISPDYLCCFDGLIFLYCSKGEFVIQKRYEEIVLTERKFATLFPDDAIRSVQRKGNSESTLTGLFLTRAFLRDLNFNLNVFSALDPTGTKPPVIKLSEQNFDMLTHYFRLLELNARSRTSDLTDVFTRNVARNLTAALFYSLMLIAREGSRRLKASTAASSPGGKSRKTLYLLDFMSLLQNNYKRHRTVGFYADRMCISPKYLSMLIKEASGKSAAEWIDECVVQEAKNLLRFSGMNVQQVAYELNFPNQSAFGKYFKNKTGLSPSRFQNT